jgi:hypothetical protein
MPLNEIQTRFKSHLLQTMPSDQAFEELFTGDPAQFEARLSIYQGNITARLQGILSARYPAVEKLVGAKFMSRLIRDYIPENPPHSGCLNDYGCHFPDFIAAYPAAESVPYLPDVARLENTLDLSAHAPDDMALRNADIEAFLGKDEIAGSALLLRQNVYLLETDYAAYDIYTYARGEENIPSSTTRKKEFILIFRPGLKPEMHRLLAQEFTFLTSIQNGHSIGEALQNASFHSPHTIRACLQKFLGLQIFAVSPHLKNMS